MKVTASCKFNDHDLTDIPVLNLDSWFGKTWLLELGGCFTPLFLVVEADTISDAIDEPGPPRHFFLSFLRFSIVTNYCTYTLYLLTITKATTNIVEICENVPQKPGFSLNAGFAIRPSPPILMRWP